MPEARYDNLTVDKYCSPM